MKKSRKVIGIVALSVVGLIVLVVTSVGGRYTVDVTHEHNFKVDMPFDQLRKIMVRSTACREIMNAGENNKLISQKWNNKNFTLGKIDFAHPNWRVDAIGELKVEFTDAYIGTAIAEFDQTVAIVPEKIDSLVKLRQPKGRLLAYDVTTQMFAKEGRSEVHQTLQLKIETPAPWYARAYARARVRASARKILRAMERHILDAIKNHEGQY